MKNKNRIILISLATVIVLVAITLLYAA